MKQTELSTTDSIAETECDNTSDFFRSVVISQAVSTNSGPKKGSIMKYRITVLITIAIFSLFLVFSTLFILGVSVALFIIFFSLEQMDYSLQIETIGKDAESCFLRNLYSTTTIIDSISSFFLSSSIHSDFVDLESYLSFINHMNSSSSFLGFSEMSEVIGFEWGLVVPKSRKDDLTTNFINTNAFNFTANDLTKFNQSVVDVVEGVNSENLNIISTYLTSGLIDLNLTSFNSINNSKIDLFNDFGNDKQWIFVYDQEMSSTSFQVLKTVKKTDLNSSFLCSNCVNGIVRGFFDFETLLHYTYTNRDTMFQIHVVLNSSEIISYPLNSYSLSINPSSLLNSTSIYSRKFSLNSSFTPSNMQIQFIMELKNREMLQSTYLYLKYVLFLVTASLIIAIWVISSLLLRMILNHLKKTEQLKLFSMLVKNIQNLNLQGDSLSQLDEENFETSTKLVKIMKILLSTIRDIFVYIPRPIIDRKKKILVKNNRGRKKIQAVVNSMFDSKDNAFSAKSVISDISSDYPETNKNEEVLSNSTCAGSIEEEVTRTDSILQKPERKNALVFFVYVKNAEEIFFSTKNKISFQRLYERYLSVSYSLISKIGGNFNYADGFNLMFSFRAVNSQSYSILDCLRTANKLADQSFFKMSNLDVSVILTKGQLVVGDYTIFEDFTRFLYPNFRNFSMFGRAKFVVGKIKQLNDSLYHSKVIVDEFIKDQVSSGVRFKCLDILQNKLTPTININEKHFKIFEVVEVAKSKFLYRIKSKEQQILDKETERIYSIVEEIFDYMKDGDFDSAKSTLKLNMETMDDFNDFRVVSKILSNVDEDLKSYSREI